MSSNHTFTIPEDFSEILTSLSKEVLRAQPSDIYQFCADYFNKRLAEQRQALLSSVERNNEEESDFNDEGQDYALKKQELQPHSQGSASDAVKSSEGNVASEEKEEGDGEQVEEDEDDETEEDEDEEEEEEEASKLPPATQNYNRGRRTSVSAESMTPTIDKDFVKVVIPKTDDQRERIRASIQNNFLFRHLDEEQYVDVVDAMAEKRIGPGVEVIKQGGIGDYFYVVETGELEVFVTKAGTTTPIRVAEYTAGGSFGELALMYNAPRAATVVSVSDSVLWALDRVTFRRILMENTSRKRRMYENFLEEVPILMSCEPYERQKISDALESVTFNDGDVVIKQGDVGDNFYIIESGEARVVKVDANGKEHELPGLKKGDYFGELALLNDKPRICTIIAKGRLKCATMGKKAFVRLLGPVVDILKRNTANYKEVSSAND